MSGPNNPADPLSGAAAILHRLKDVLSREPRLADEVRRAGTPQAAAETLARIGALRGIATDAAELRAHVARLAPAQRPRPLSDDALDAVAGGIGGASDETWNAVLNALVPASDRGGF